METPGVPAIVADPLLCRPAPRGGVNPVTVSGTRRDGRYPPVPAIVVSLAQEFPAVPARAVFRAVGKARRTVEQGGTTDPATRPDEIERLAREELRRWRPAHPLAAETPFPTRTGWRYGD
jgi:hypothetical protein